MDDLCGNICASNLIQSAVGVLNFLPLLLLECRYIALMKVMHEWLTPDLDLQCL